MKIAYFDCIAGASGDMILGALLDAGLSEQELRARLAGLHLAGFDLDVHRVVKNGFSATKVDVIVSDGVPARHLADIEAIVTQSELPQHIREKAIAIFRRLGEVEAGIHGVPLEQVHLHELGGVDTIVDVAGALVGLDALGVERVYASPLPLGRGFARGAHGKFPLPAPATVALLKGVPVTGSELEMELVTPTGAALLVSLAESFGPIPAMTLTAVGYGAGGWDLPIPNVLRLLVGEATSPGAGTIQTLVMLATNIDDLNPQFYEHVMARLFAAGALDVTLAPIQMKKNRPGTQLEVLCLPDDAQTMTEILFTETSTLGVRRQLLERHALPRLISTIETPYGVVRVKTARLGSGRGKSVPEYDDCRRLAEQHNLPLSEIYRAVTRVTEQTAAGEKQP